MNVFPGHHFVCWHTNEQPNGVRLESSDSRETMEAMFYNLTADPAVNWIKWFMIRDSDGKYLFERDYQTRT